MNGSTRSVATRMLAARGLLVAVLLPAALPTTTSGQQPQPGVKERKVALKDLPANARVIGLTFEVIHVDADGVHKPVNVAPEQYPFSIGDEFFLRIKPQSDLFVYVFTEGPDGKRSRLLPESPDKPLRVVANKEIDIPSDGRKIFTFEAPAGEEKLIVVAMEEHKPQDMDRLLQQAFQWQGQKFNPNGNKARGGKKQMANRVGKLVPGSGDIQVEAIPDEETPYGEVTGINTSNLVVGISLNSRPRDQQAK